jgi:hypothetical protein
LAEQAPIDGDLLKYIVDKLKEAENGDNNNNV